MSDTPRASFKFTKGSLTALKPSTARYKVFDTSLPAFGVRVEPSGRKTFQLSFRVAGRWREATLGTFGLVTVDGARNEARRMLGLIARGVDPLSGRDARKALTVSEALSRWFAEHVVPRRKPKTVRQYRLASGHIIRSLGRVPIAQVASADVAKLHGRLHATPYLANRVVATLSACCTWAERQGLRPQHSNPCLLVERFPEQSHRRYLSEDEYARLGQALDDAETDGTVSPIALTAIRLLLLTGCRPQEVMSLRWEHVDLGAGMLRLPDSKTGRKDVFLPAEAIRLLRLWHRFEGSPFVFPGTGHKTVGKHLVNLSKPWYRLRKTAGLDDVRLYDAVRHSFASVAISTHAQPLSVIGELLGHSQAATTKRYAHLHDDVAREQSNRIGGTIAAALSRKVPA